MTTQIKPAPVIKSITVRASPERAFAVFTADMGRWWPPTHHIGKAAYKDAVLEPRAGGRWYEIGRKPQALTNGCVAGWTEYKPLDKGRIDVLDACYDKTPSGKLKTIGGPAEVLDTATHAKIHVRYKLGIFPIGKDYWILDHDADYTWFLEASPSFAELWIYTRAANPSPELVQELIGKAKAFGYDTSRLEFPTQTGK